MEHAFHLFFSSTIDADESSDSSFGFSELKRKDPERENAIGNGPSIVTDPKKDQINCAASTSVLHPIANEELSSELEQNKPNTRPVRQRIPNRQLESYVIPSIQSNSSRRQAHTPSNIVSSLNCRKSPKTISAHPSILTSKSVHRRQPESPQKCSKKAKISPPPCRKMVPSKGRFDTASIGDLKLPWPRYNIKSKLYNGTVYTIQNTCSLDSVLFVYYFIFKTASTSIINLFNRGGDPIYHIVNKTMELVEANGWDVARLHWLTANYRLPDNTNTTNATNNKSYDLFGTVDGNAYRYLRAMQTHVWSTECLAIDCPKRKLDRKSTEIVLR